MLRELRIRNYALIDRLELQLPEGLVAFTGETGAGKSIIIGALALALGSKAQTDQLRSGASEITVEAVFSGPAGDRARTVLEGAGIPSERDLVLRRVVPATGKTRAYINDTAATLLTLEALGRELVDIHGQHHHQSLLRPETHLEFLDGFGRLAEARENLGDLFRRWAELKQEGERISSGEAEKARRLDFLTFQKEEIERAGLTSGEEEDLASQREILRHAEKLAAASAEAGELIYSGETPASAQVDRAVRRLAEAAAVDASLGPLLARLEESQLQLEEAGREIQSYCRRVEADPGRLQEVEERLARIGGLKKKYGSSVEAVLGHLEHIRSEIDALDSSAERLAVIAKELPAAEKRLGDAAEQLSRKREKSRRALEERVLAELAHLNLRGCAFKVALERVEDSAGVPLGGRKFRVDEKGVDRAEFLVSANPGEPLRPLARVASGGELSRIMLAVKTVLAGLDRIPTLVFDEVDIGIGGRTARIVGERLLGVSSGRQVLCVTHLPQIASLADSHYNIEKHVRGKRTVVRVKPLGGQDRIDEIARMLGGREITDTTRRHAAELLRRAH